VHQATAVLGLTCLATAAALYLEPIARSSAGARWSCRSTSGRARAAGAGACSAGRRGRCGRTTGCSTGGPGSTGTGCAARPAHRRPAVGKFNAGQKLNASLSAGGGLVLLGTGIVLEYGRRWPLDLRIGATFVHDWDGVRGAAAGRRARLVRRTTTRTRCAASATGRVPVGWALHEHPAWARGLLGAAAGEDRGMDPDQERVRHRADDLLPEERAAGSDDPEAQAAAILADSDEREYDPQAAPDTVLERRTSADATDPPA
jgi:formate dehydrogenase subunit gamma